MRIVDLETFQVASEPEAGNGSPSRTWTVVRVLTDQGLEGIGRGGPAAEGIIQEHLKPLLIGSDPLRTESLWEKMYQASGSAGIHPRNRYVAAMGPVDVALWDIRGKALDVPVYRLLGGFRDRVPAYGDPIWCTPGEEGKAGEDAEALLDEGFTAVKLHLAVGDVGAAVELMRQVRRTIGDGVELGLDLYQEWDPLAAIELAQRCEELDIAWLEEPAMWDDQVGGLALVASATRIPVSAGEAECTLYACRDLMERGGVKIIQPDIIGAGGFTQVARISHLAAAFHAWSAPHGASYPEFNAHMVAAHPNGLMVSTWPPSWPDQIWTRLYREPIPLVDSWLELPQRPGLGLELDWGYIESHRA